MLCIVGPKNNFNVCDYFSCTSVNVIYVIRCKRCGIIYIGETKRRLADRITEHLRSIRLKLKGHPVASHFNPPSPCRLCDFSVSGILHAKGGDHDRLVLENRLIFKLGTLSPSGLNVEFDLL